MKAAPVKRYWVQGVPHKVAVLPDDTEQRVVAVLARRDLIFLQRLFRTNQSLKKYELFRRRVTELLTEITSASINTREPT